MMNPLKIEILTYAPTEYYHCNHCETVWNQTNIGKNYHQDQISNGLPEDMFMEYTNLSGWILKLSGTYSDHIVIKVINVASMEGMLKSLWHRVRRYPAIIVGGMDVFIGTDLSTANSFIADRLADIPTK